MRPIQKQIFSISILFQIALGNSLSARADSFPVVGALSGFTACAGLTAFTPFGQRYIRRIAYSKMKLSRMFLTAIGPSIACAGAGGALEMAGTAAIDYFSSSSERAQKMREVLEAELDSDLAAAVMGDLLGGVNVAESLHERGVEPAVQVKILRAFKEIQVSGENPAILTAPQAERLVKSLSTATYSSVSQVMKGAD